MSRRSEPIVLEFFAQELLEGDWSDVKVKVREDEEKSDEQEKHIFDSCMADLDRAFIFPVSTKKLEAAKTVENDFGPAIDLQQQNRVPLLALPGSNIERSKSTVGKEQQQQQQQQRAHLLSTPSPYTSYRTFGSSALASPRSSLKNSALYLTPIFNEAAGRMIGKAYQPTFGGTPLKSIVIGDQLENAGPHTRKRKVGTI